MDEEHRTLLITLAEGIIKEWVETAYQTTLCGEARLHPGAERMRHLHLAEPWLPATKIADKYQAIVSTTQVFG